METNNHLQVAEILPRYYSMRNIPVLTLAVAYGNVPLPNSVGKHSSNPGVTNNFTIQRVMERLVCFFCHSLAVK